MSWYKECEHCGATLDPGEQCDCAAEFLGSTKKRERPQKRYAHPKAILL